MQNECPSTTQMRSRSEKRARKRYMILDPLTPLTRKEANRFHCGRTSHQTRCNVSCQSSSAPRIAWAASMNFSGARLIPDRYPRCSIWLRSLSMLEIHWTGSDVALLGKSPPFSGRRTNGRLGATGGLPEPCASTVLLSPPMPSPVRRIATSIRRSRDKRFLGGEAAANALTNWVAA